MKREHTRNALYKSSPSPILPRLVEPFVQTDPTAYIAALLRTLALVVSALAVIVQALLSAAPGQHGWDGYQ